MLRRIYFLGLLLLLCIINISFCYDYLSNDELNSKEVNRRTVGRKARRKFKRRNQAQIDVASFIQSPDQSSLDDNNQPYEQYKQKIGNQGIDNSNFGSYANTNDEFNKDTKEYQYLNGDTIPEVNILHANHFVPQHMKLNGLSMDEIISQNNEPHKLGALTKLDFPYNTKVERSSQKEKKCASLRKIKIPFFSLNKAKEKEELQETIPKTKEKKDKKRRRLFGSRKQKKQSTITSKLTVLNTKHTMEKSTKAITNDSDEIFKRSYLEKLCPACKHKFLGNSKSDDKARKSSNNIIHNSRQYFQRKSNHKVIENDKPCHLEIKSNSLENNDDFESSMKDQRWKRDVDTIEERQKKLLEELEKKVESVTVNNNQDN